MKANKIERKRSKGILAICALLFIVLLATGVTLAYAELQSLWQDQCVVTDVTSQVTCTDGAMVKSGTILDRFGIRNGANLARIDFAARRQEILRDIPNIRAISATRQMPNRVEITVEERRPIVRLGVHGRSKPTGRVADSEGMVFTCRRGTGMLPTVRERETAVTPVGKKLTGRNLAALRLIETASNAEFASLGILDADIAKPDYILATLGNYAQAKIAWSGMDNPTESNRSDLLTRLNHLQEAIKSNIGPDAKVWNATEATRIYADTRENL